MDNKTGVFSKYHTDEFGNPISIQIVEEERQVSPTLNVIQLNEIPDEYHRLTVKNENDEILHEVFDIEQLTNKSYKVNYSSGVVHFSKDNKGKTFKVSYYGRGVEMINSNRVGIADNEFGHKTIQDIVDENIKALHTTEVIKDVFYEAEVGRNVAETDRRVEELARVEAERKREESLGEKLVELEGIYAQELHGVKTTSNENKDKIAILTDDLGQTNAQLSTINRKELEIDVLNPPSSTGLLPLTGRDDGSDTEKLQAIFDYIGQNETQFQPNNRGYFGFDYKIKFPANIITLNNSIEIKGGYLTLDGNKTVFRMIDKTKPVFNISGSNAKKMNVNYLTFDSCDAFLIDKQNIDHGMVDFFNCQFLVSPDYALKITDQSAMYTFRKCHWYQCRYIIKVFNCDYTLFSQCWFSESPRIKDLECSGYFYGEYAEISDSFIIPSGLSNTGEELLTDVAWFETNKSLVVKDCRVSAEPNNKTLINSKGVGVTSPFESINVEVSNCHRLASTNGKCVVRLFRLPNKLRIVNNSLSIYDSELVGIATNVNVENDTNYNTKSDYAFSIIVDENVAQNSSAYKINSLLRKFLKNSLVENDIVFKDNTIKGARKGVSSGSSFSFSTTHMYNGSTICDSMYQVKMTWQTDSSSTNARSVILGVLSFVGKRTSTGTQVVEVEFHPTLSKQGGSAMSQSSEISYNVKFGKPSSNQYTPTSGDTDTINIHFEITSPVQGNISYTVNEVTDNSFIF